MAEGRRGKDDRKQNTLNPLTGGCNRDTMTGTLQDMTSTDDKDTPENTNIDRWKGP
jgi:hypothetical protein